MNITFEMSDQFMEQFNQIIKESINEAVRGLVTEDRVMTKKEVADFLQVSIPTVNELMRQGLPYFQHGQVIRFLYSDLVGWLHENSCSVARSK